MTELKTGTLVRCLLISFTIIFASTVISGCGGGGGGGGDSTTSGTPDIVLVRAETNFGIVVLDKSADRHIKIWNQGNENLSIGQITLPANPFSMINDSCSGADIPSGSNCELTIRFAPTTQKNYTGSFDIPSNDSDAGLLTASLLGMGRALNVSINRIAIIGPQTVQLVVSVRDQLNDPVTTLAKSNFTIFEDGSPKSILNVSNTINPGVSIGMALDYSESMLSLTPDVQNAAKSFVDLLDPVNDEAEVNKFSEDIEVMVPFTQDHVALKAAIDAAPLFPLAYTHLYDAIWTSINSTSLRSNPRLVNIVVSDGKDLGSTRNIIEVIANAVDTNVQIFTIGIGAVNSVILDRLASETGGQYFYDPTASDLTNVYATISEILYNEYTIEYTTSSAAGSTISLDVMVDDNGGQLGEDSRTAGL